MLDREALCVWARIHLTFKLQHLSKTKALCSSMSTKYVPIFLFKNRITHLILDQILDGLILFNWLVGYFHWEKHSILIHFRRFKV